MTRPTVAICLDFRAWRAETIHLHERISSGQEISAWRKETIHPHVRSSSRNERTDRVHLHQHANNLRARPITIRGA